jgi:hypothetical protein
MHMPVATRHRMCSLGVMEVKVNVAFAVMFMLMRVDVLSEREAQRPQTDAK